MQSLGAGRFGVAARGLAAGLSLILGAIGLVGVLVPPTVAGAVTDPGSVSSPVHSLVPARVVDTRSAPDGVTVDGLSQGTGPVVGGTAISPVVTGRGGVPSSGVAAVVLNVTATQAWLPTFVTVFPKGSNRPNASNLNVVPGATVANLVVAKVGSGGAVSIYNNSGAMHVIVDVVGWVADAPEFGPLVPARLMDSRPGALTVDGANAGQGAIGQGSLRSLLVTGRGGVPATGVGSVVVNVTVTNPTMSSFLTVYPSGTTRPNASNLNFTPGQTVPNLVVAKVGPDGSIALYNNSGATDVIVDVVGWIATTPVFGPLVPARLLDTRPAPVGATTDGLEVGAGPIGEGTSHALSVLGRGGVSAAGIGSVVVNVTVTNPTTSSFLTVYPSGTTRPNASNLNFTPGQTVPNLVVAKVGPDGAIALYNNSGATDVIVDVVGWFLDDATSVASNVVLTDPSAIAFSSLDPNGTSTGTVDDPSAYQVGDVVVTTTSDGPLYGTVTDKTGSTITTTPAGLLDVFPDLNLDVTANADTGTVTSNASAATPAGFTEPAHAMSAPVSCSGSVSATATVDWGASAGDFWIKAQAKKTLGVPTSLDSFEIGYHPSAWANATARLAVSGSCRLNQELAKVVLTPITFTIGPVPVVITQDISVAIEGTLSAEASVTVGVGVRADAWLGSRWTKTNGWSLINNASVSKSIDPGTPQVTGRGDLSLPITYTALAYGIVGFAPSVVLFAELNVDALHSPYLTLDAGLKGEISVVLTLFGFVTLSHTFGPYEFYRKNLLTIANRPSDPAGKLTYTGGTWNVDGADGFALNAGRLVTDGSFPLSVAVAPGGDTPPAWLQISMNGQSVALSGTPAGTGTWNFSVTVTDDRGDHVTVPVHLAVTVPVDPPPTGPLTGVTQISAAYGHSCALLTGGSIKCWGLNWRGALGDGTTTDSFTPVSVVGISTATSISTGDDHSCALLVGGSIKCWGYNYYGQLGDGSYTDSSTPVSVVGISTATSISTFTAHSCAVLLAGSIKCWGSNSIEQRGDGISYRSSTPVSVVGISTATSVSVGSYHSCALLEGGSIKCWGYNYYGLLGDGSYTDSSTPVSVVGISTATSISVGYFHSCALLEGGSIKCWGITEWGELGNGTTTSSNVPVSVIGISTATSISAGGYHSCALLAGGSIKCWGYNAFGQLGDGATTNSSVPVSVVSG